MNIYDIAEKAGVSIATVSRVLNESDNVSPKTKAKVLAAIEETGYTPNIFARGLGLNSIKMIGVLCIDVADMYYAKAVSSLEKLLRAEEYDVLLYCTGETREEKCRCINRLLDKRVDAIITIGSSFTDNLLDDDFKQAVHTVPVIMINGRVDMPGIYSISCDEAAATENSVKQLYHCGYSNILYLYDCETASGKAKMSGFQNAITQLGITKHSYTIRSPRTVGDGCAVAQAILQKHPHINAIVTSEDILAVGALQALDKLGKKAPVIGFNNSLLAECTLPTLTSVDNMVEVLCSTSVSILTEIFKEKPVPERIVLSPRLVERNSFRTGSNADK
ncbi:MAG: LacI family DNA-binding transcriptional regulator [Oscillospiraceae bacterium]|nr:LacI family DNA-binding transcriptional regulator [Oscillospiraceae bacterium]